MTDLGTLGGTNSNAYGINDSGQVVGMPTPPATPLQHAFLYSGSTMTDLGTLGGTISSATGINASGQVVGNATTHRQHCLSRLPLQRLDDDRPGHTRRNEQRCHWTSTTAGRSWAMPTPPADALIMPSSTAARR